MIPQYRCPQSARRTVTQLHAVTAIKIGVVPDTGRLNSHSRCLQWSGIRTLFTAQLVNTPTASRSETLVIRSAFILCYVCWQKKLFGIFQQPKGVVLSAVITSTATRLQYDALQSCRSVWTRHRFLLTPLLSHSDERITTEETQVFSESMSSARHVYFTTEMHTHTQTHTQNVLNKSFWKFYDIQNLNKRFRPKTCHEGPEGGVEL